MKGEKFFVKGEVFFVSDEKFMRESTGRPAF